MRKAITAVSLVVALLLAGCVHSLQPVYTTRDVVFEPALVGEWVDEESTWTVTRAGGNAYAIVHADKNGRTGRFVAHLFRLGPSLFIDVAPADTALRYSDFYQDHLLESHSFFMVVRTAPTPQFAYLSPDWLRSYVNANPDALRHEKIGDRILITASTADVQRFLLSQANVKGAFERSKPFSRAADFPR